MHDDFDDEDDLKTCFRCDGAGEVPCHCGGDLCVCGDEDVECPACKGDGLVTAERYERQIARHRELMKAVWGKDDAGR